MHTTGFLLFVLILCGRTVFPQSAVSKDVADFIPAGFTLLDSAWGDLNQDKFSDVVLVLKSNQEERDPELNRPLVLLAGSRSGNYKMIASNDSVVLCKACGGVMGDPFQGITIKRGYFSVEHYGGSSWRWTKIITFKYDTRTSEFRLHRDAGESFHASAPEKVKITVSRKEEYGKLPFTQYSYDQK